MTIEMTIDTMSYPYNLFYSTNIRKKIVKIIRIKQK